MKILSTKQICEADAYTIAHEPISSIDLMERAARTCSDWILNHLDKSVSFKIFCGTGNNGGDGLAIARLLGKDVFRVEVYVVRYSNNSSPDFLTNAKRL